MVRQCLKAWIAAALCALLAVGFAAGGALAQSDAAGDPPARVGRLSAVDGVVSFHTSDQDQWSPAMLNYPVSAGTSFWTEPSARAALELGPAVIHLGSQTEFDVVALDDHNFQGQIGQGEIHLRLYALAPGDSYQIVTARGTIQITAPGRYHIDGGTDSTPTRVAVFDGAAEFVGNGANLAIHPGEAAQVTGLDPVTYDVAAAAPDPMDSWADAGDARQRMVDAPRYVSPEMTGYQDLDGYGAWQQSPDAGPVWIPSDVPADWAPYRYGHWAYVAPWGWTWIDDASWGFAPFHYGRWARWHDRWAWYPGERIERPVYAPALVAFVGGPPARDIGIGLAIGGIAAAAAWIPLGPHEVYDPPYRHSPTYIRNVNVANVTNVTVNKTVTVNHYANAASATVVPAAAMTSSQPIAHAAVKVPAAQLAARPVVAAPPAVHPTLATTGTSAATVRAAGGTADPAHARRAAAGPLITQGHPATAVTLSRVQPPTPGPRPAPPRVLAAHEMPPNAGPSVGPMGAAPSAAAVPPPAEHHPAPAGAAPGPPIAPHGAPPTLPSAHETPATPAGPPPAAAHPPAPAVEAHREGPPPAEPPHPAAAPLPPHPAAAPPPPHPAPAVEAHHEAPPHPVEPPHPAAAPPAPPHPAVEAHREAPPHPVEPPHPAPPPHPAVEAHAPPPPPHPAAPPPPAAHPAPPPPHPAPAHEAKKEEEHH